MRGDTGNPGIIPDSNLLLDNSTLDFADVGATHAEHSQRAVVNHPPRPSYVDDGQVP